MPTQVLTPLDFGAATKLTGRVFRKQILPVGSINYQGRRIEFSREKLAAIEAAYRDQAFDFVPLVLADEKNTHTMDPRATSGKVIDMELAADGLDVIVHADDEAAQLLEKHPEIGISARILENYDRADGRHYPAAIQHALITADPRITGMRPWEAVNLSIEVDNTVDLTAATFADDTKEEPMAQLTDDELAKLRSLLAEFDNAPTGNDNPGDQPAEDKPEDTPGDPELTDEELEAIALEALAAEGGETPAEDAPAPSEPELVTASNDSAAVELANARTAELQVQLANIQAQLDQRNYEAERDKLASEYGIPPAVTELAKPLLLGSNVIELSNGDSVDAGAVMRKVLTEFGRQIKLLDLSSPLGSAVETDQDKAKADELRSWVGQARAQLGV
ncbi:hypothetical protein [Amycolatopsis taiwanensis]|uniref:hypothetical protein n=1 Tax=Amycolatopsis taiwanensis TaxID=342230 RepID=UPI0004B8FDCC|nr:hypothetical protein [Amycolatopsis taiwanensis]